ncbi:unnamed protein product [Brachionus calyciflorus]|uniref:SLC41A/MgtE integral membrane domain-containing protein n=1 Tax=Brachionus calyciflorus TaxID=104777 RepID=A0A813M639_9BILA|nr:unnamed protein product [Brachionus calyciflorus]
MPDLKNNLKETQIYDNVAIVPIVNIINETLETQDSNNIDDEPMLQDVNSTTNLLGLARAESEAGFLKAETNLSKASSQTSIESSLKYGDNIDMIPLMPVTSNIQINQLVPESSHKPSEERWYSILIQVIFPFFIAGFGMVGSGVVLDTVKHWPLFLNIKAIFTLIPALSGLKGNLEMTLASRFSTQVNLGLIKDKSTIMSAVLGNLALTQAQAIVVGFSASIGALILEFFTKDTSIKFDYQNGLVLIAGCMSTASFASLVLAGLMMYIIIISKKFNINPDNIATPIAASLGDLVTIGILAYLCTFLFEIKSMLWIHILIIISFLVLIPIFIYYAYHNDFVKDALRNGWVPILLAMAISSAGGFIMGFAIDNFDDVAIFQPVVNGVGGNLVAIFASRLSTALHKTSDQGTIPSWAPKKWYLYFSQTFFGKSNPESDTGLILALLSIPGHLIFYFIITKIKVLQGKEVNPAILTPSFVSFYTSVAILQVVLLLLICYWLVHLTWRKNMNPDNVCIPYLTAIGDLLGTAFLAICFYTLYAAGETRLKTS